MADRQLSHTRAAAYLLGNLEPAQLALLVGLMIASSLTEGIGLVLLLPAAQFIAGDSGVTLPQWLNGLNQLSFATILTVLAVIIILRAVIVYFANETRRNAGLALAREFRESAHDALMQAEWRWLAQQNSADHAALIIGESERSASLLNDALTIATKLTTLCVLAIAAALIAPSLVLILLLAALPLCVIGFGLKSKYARGGEAYWEAYSRLQRLLSDGVKHLRATRIAGAEAGFARQVTAASRDLAELERAYFRAAHRIQMLFQITAVIALALGIYAALIVWNISIIVLLPILLLAVRAVPLVSSAFQAWRSWRYNKPALEGLLAQNQDAEIARESSGETGTSLAFTREITLDGVAVRFAGRDQPALSKTTASIAKGSVIAIAGRSGSGKSTLADVLAGLISPDSGAVSIDGVRLDAANRYQWRQQIGYVEQDPFFFDASIRSNLTWAKEDLSDAQIHRALRDVAADFVLDLPDGLETRLGEGGRQLSGGEQQRLAIARALLANPQVLILDEITSALDKNNSAHLLETIKSLRGACTVVLLSHDAQVLSIVDQCIKLENPM